MIAVAAIERVTHVLTTGRCSASTSHGTTSCASIAPCVLLRQCCWRDGSCVEHRKIPDRLGEIPDYGSACCLCHNMDGMGLFSVIALKETASAVDEAVTSKIPGDKAYKIESGKWAINSELTTARELSTALGLRETHTHIVFSFKGYSGRAQPDLWEWLAAQVDK